MLGRGRGRGGLPFANPRPSLGFPPRTSQSCAATFGSAASGSPTCSQGVPAGPAAPPTFIEKLSKLSQEPEYLDFTIACNDVQYKVSRLMISAHSPYFKRASNGPFKEGVERVITLQEDEPKAVRAMIQYFRERTYEGPGTTSPTFHVGMFIIADKYEVMALKDLALDHFTKSIMALSMEDLAQMLVSITPHVYAATPADNRLREILLLRWQSSGIASSIGEELEMLVSDCPAFGTGLILKLTPLRSQSAPLLDAQNRVHACFLSEAEYCLISLSTITRKTGLSEKEISLAISMLKAAGRIGQGPVTGSWYRQG